MSTSNANAPGAPVQARAAPDPSLSAPLMRQIPLPGGRSLDARIYAPEARDRPMPLVLHFHGGAFVGGSLDSGAPVAELLAQAGSVVVSLDYPLAPAHPFPDAAEAGHAAAQWMHRNRRRLGGPGAVLLVAGEEAGGNLAAAVAMMARDRLHPPLAGQILLSPMLDPVLGTASLRAARGDDSECPWRGGWASYLSQVADACHPYAAPGICLRLGGLAPALVVTANDDPMRDEALSFAGRLRAAGVAANEVVIAAATGWPQGHAIARELPAAWTDELKEHLRQFFITCQHAPSLKGDSPS